MNNSLTKYNIGIVYEWDDTAFAEPIEDEDGIYYRVEEIDIELKRLKDRTEYLERLYIKIDPDYY